MKDTEACCATVHGVAEVDATLVIEQQKHNAYWVTGWLIKEKYLHVVKWADTVMKEWTRDNMTRLLCELWIPTH